ncbi:MAG TPA: hypothetical protein VMI34_23975 [Candidatus Bathyarchaeia archaeon]|nr:hypothetical protein [Candidatus Bathyarchaeia archaeon]
MIADSLLEELESPSTGLARFVDAVVRNGMPYVIVPAAAVKAWRRDEPRVWAKVERWLADHHVEVVAV